MRIVLALFFVLGAVALTGQAVLYSEDFNGCALPTDWSIDLTGNPDARWWVGEPLNDNDDGSTIDGSCMLIFDDDLTGEQTPAWTAELRTPEVDITGWTTVALAIDVHFRNYNGSASLEIFAFDGDAYQSLTRYQGAASQTGVQFSEFATFTADLSFYANPRFHLLIRYDDGADWAWWAGIDNIRIVGEGAATNLLLETFNSCGLPDGWTTQFSGDHDWQFGLIQNSNASATSLNGTCMAYFDDDGITQAAPPSVVRLLSPEIDGSAAYQMYLDFDVIFRRYSAYESFSVGVLDVETGESRIVAQYFADLGGPQFNNFIHEQIDLTAFRARQMRVFFQYDDAADWNWWVGIDNVKLSGEGQLNETCAQAVPLTIDGACLAADNRLALFTGTQPSCSARNVGSLWYTFTATATGLVKVTTEAAFNDLVTVYQGACGSLQEVSCLQADEHGFTGEVGYLLAEAGQTYWLRVSGEQARFGQSRGIFCIQLATVPGIPPPPANDGCATAQLLAIDNECLVGENVHATSTNPATSTATLARSDVWYRFTPSSATPLRLATSANFADVLTLYRGGCANLTEVKVAEYGAELRLDNPTPGEEYHWKVSGAFATVEGQLCGRVETSPEAPPANDLCAGALPLVMNGPCVSAHNRGANFDGPAVSCEPNLSGSIWFRFVAPNSGTVRLLPDADFAYGLSVYQGACAQLNEVFCARNLPACDGFFTVSSLTPGVTYYIRVSSSANTAGFAERGAMCLSVLDAATAPPWSPLALQVDPICYDNGLAVLGVTVSGGSGGYVFNGNQPNEVLAPGDAYLLVATDNNGCERAVSGVVGCEANPNCTLSVNLLVQAASCADGQDGSAAVAEVSGGAGPYQLSWSTGDTDTAIDQLASGLYRLTVSDNGGCQIVLPVQINAPAPLALLGSEVIPASNGQPNGSISLEVAGGVGPYTFEWRQNNNLIATTTEPVLANLPAGVYSVVVYDAGNCADELGAFTVENISGTSDPAADGSVITLAPVPTSGLLTATWQLPTNRPLALRLYTVEGRSWRLAQGLPAQAIQYPLDLRAWPAGVYWLRWDDGERRWQRKLVVIAQ